MIKWQENKQLNNSRDRARDQGRAILSRCSEWALSFVRPWLLADENKMKIVCLKYMYIYITLINIYNIEYLRISTIIHRQHRTKRKIVVLEIVKVPVSLLFGS